MNFHQTRTSSRRYSARYWLHSFHHYSDTAIRFHSEPISCRNYRNFCYCTRRHGNGISNRVCCHNVIVIFALRRSIDLVCHFCCAFNRRSSAVGIYVVLIPLICYCAFSVIPASQVSFPDVFPTGICRLSTGFTEKTGFSRLAST